jgi:ring-1,2-phenylacetyl-CoA epoxidase subunit PaaD
MSAQERTVDPVADPGVESAVVRAAVESVPDPELPPVTIGMLGMVHDLAVGEDGDVVVELLPTFSGCPATEMIERDVVGVVGALDGVTSVTVRFRFDPPWTPDRIDQRGREALREFGITPPGGPIRGAVAPSEGGRTLPLASTPSTPSSPPASSTPRPCPYCSSEDTTMDSAFGPTPCRDVRYCNACQQPFEAFKAL